MISPSSPPFFRLLANIRQRRIPPGYPWLSIGWIALVLLVLTGCGSEVDREDEDDSIGPTVEVEVLLELGLPGSEPLFGRVGSVALGDSGSIFVVDQLAQMVYSFDSTGGLVRTLGRQGPGPYEYSYADGVIVSPADGVVWVFDARGAKVVGFTPEGDPVASIGVPRGGTVTPWPGLVLEGGGILHWTFDVGDEGLRTLTPHVVMSDGGSVAMPPLTTTVPSRDGVRIPLDGFLAMNVGSEGTIWYSDRNDYLVLRRDLEGAILSRVQLDGAVPQAVGQAELDSVRQRYSASDITFGPEDLPTEHPFIDRVLSNGDGLLYVVPRLEGRATGTVLHLFDEDTGEFRGRADLPFSIGRFTPVSARGNLVASVLRDELDVETVVVARIDPSGS